MISPVNSLPKTCDIFCIVVDNYGDIGVSWRLARQLANEHGIRVRLWVDDLLSFAKLCPEVNTVLEEQGCRGVEIRRWPPFHNSSSGGRRALLRSPTGGGTEGGGDAISPHQNVNYFSEIQSAELVIEAFACKLPESYIQAMASQECKPVWINLEYLSAEEWVEGAHKLPSPHSRLPLVKYFFFPGFTEKTGGLLLERDLLAKRDLFQVDRASSSPALPRSEREFWRSMGMPERVEGELRVSLFSYENDTVTDLLQAWVQGATPVVCCVPEGRVLPQVDAYFGQAAGKAGDTWQRGNLRVQVLPFVEQERYDELLWACDINFVRGEDSCVRAQWAGKPFVWHIYPQQDGVHMQKLLALNALYCEGLSELARQANQDLWLVWNGEGNIAKAWQAYALQREELARHAQVWSAKLAGNNLALNLLDFFSQVGRMRAFEI
jgi:uncharacterized repeat protein (TIGR03837 family)